MTNIPVSLLADLLHRLYHHVPSARVDAELGMALQATGYPQDALEVTVIHAVDILDRLDVGIVRCSTRIAGQDSRLGQRHRPTSESQLTE